MGPLTDIALDDKKHMSLFSKMLSRLQPPVLCSFSYEVMDDEGNSVSEERHETYEEAEEISNALTELTGDRHSVKILGMVEAR